MKMQFYLFLSFLLVCFNLRAQDFTGLWEITNVSVGSETMTPVAKWTRINADQTYESGNGWLQNAKGTWSYNEKTRQYSPENTLGLKDEYGGFEVKLTADEMIWNREEDGTNVVVTFKRIEELPKSPADMLTGLWASIDPDRNESLFFRWDRIYVKQGKDGTRTTGYWHINGHKPEVTFLSGKEGTNPESWQVEVDDKELIMRGISDSNRGMTKTFRRK